MTKISANMRSHNIRPLEELTLMDDYMFAAVMHDQQNLKPLLEYILGIKISQIKFVESQKSGKEGYRSKGVRMDLYIMDDEGRIFNVEIQTSKKKNLPKRMRYYQSVIDNEVLAPGADYNNLNRSFVIFICSYDPYDRGWYLYSFENLCIEDPQLAFGDESYKVIVNTKGTAGKISSELKEVLQYLNNGKVTGKYTKQLNEAVNRVKTNEDRRHEYMIMMIHDMELLEEGKILGAVEEMRDNGKEECDIIQKLKTKYKLSQEEAEKYVLTNDIPATR